MYLWGESRATLGCGEGLPEAPRARGPTPHGLRALSRLIGKGSPHPAPHPCPSLPWGPCQEATTPSIRYRHLPNAFCVPCAVPGTEEPWLDGPLKALSAPAAVKRGGPTSSVEGKTECPVTHWLRDLGRVTPPLWASVCSSVK